MTKPTKFAFVTLLLGFSWASFAQTLPTCPPEMDFVLSMQLYEFETDPAADRVLDDAAEAISSGASQVCLRLQPTLVLEEDCDNSTWQENSLRLILIRRAELVAESLLDRGILAEEVFIRELPRNCALPLVAGHPRVSWPRYIQIFAN